MRELMHEGSRGQGKHTACPQAASTIPIFYIAAIFYRDLLLVGSYWIRVIFFVYLFQYK